MTIAKILTIIATHEMQCTPAPWISHPSQTLASEMDLIEWDDDLESYVMTRKGILKLKSDSFRRLIDSVPGLLKWVQSAI